MALLPGMAGGDDDGAGPFPELAVFDLDACFWDKESEFLFRVLEVGRVERQTILAVNLR